MREAQAALIFDASFDAVRKKLADLKAELEQPISLNFRMGGGGPTSGGDVATFGNTSGMMSNMPDAMTRLDVMSTRNTGASVAAQNGRPGVPTNNMVEQAAGQTAGDVLQNRADARAANTSTWTVAGASDEWNRGDGMPPDVDVNRPGAKFTVPRGGHGAMPDPKGVATSGDVPTTRLERLHQQMTDAQVAAEAYHGFPEAGGYARQAARAELAYTAALYSSDNPELDRQRSRALEQQQREQTRTVASYRDLFYRTTEGLNKDDEATNNAYEAQKSRALLQQFNQSEQRQVAQQKLNERTVSGYRDLFYKTREQLDADDEATSASYESQKSRALLTQHNAHERGMARAEANRDNADFAAFKEQERAERRAASGGGTRYGGILSRLADARAALESARGTEDEAAYQREYDATLGEQAIARGLASPIGNGNPASRPQSLRAMLSRYAMTGIGIYAGGAAIQAFSASLGVGQYSPGYVQNQGLQNELGQLAVGQGLINSVPVAGNLMMGASDLVARLLNSARGRGAVTRQEYLQHSLDEQNLDIDAFQNDRLNKLMAKRFRSNSDLDRIDADRDIEIQQLWDSMEKDHGKFFKDSTSNNFTPAGEAYFRSHSDTIELRAAEKRHQLLIQQASMRAESMTAKQAAEADLNRDPVGVLAATAYSEYHAYTGDDETTREILRKRGADTFAAGLAKMSRDFGDQASDAGLVRSGFSLQAALNQIGRERVGLFLNPAIRNDPVASANANAAFDSRIADANLTDARANIGVATTIRQSQFLLSDNPFEAQIAGILGNFMSTTAGMTPMSPEYLRAMGVMTAQGAVAAHERDYERSQIRLSQHYEGESLDRLMERDTVGAQASRTAGDAISRAMALYHAGHHDEAGQALKLGVQQLNVDAKEYGLSFRGQQVDLRSMDIFNARDAQDPSKMFAEFEQAKKEVAGANLKGNDSPDALPTMTGLTDLIKGAVKDVIAGLTGD